LLAEPNKHSSIWTILFCCWFLVWLKIFVISHLSKLVKYMCIRMGIWLCGWFI